MPNQPSGVILSLPGQTISRTRTVAAPGSGGWERQFRDSAPRYATYPPQPAAQERIGPLSCLLALRQSRAKQIVRQHSAVRRSNYCACGGARDQRVNLMLRSRSPRDFASVGMLSSVRAGMEGLWPPLHCQLHRHGAPKSRLTTTRLRSAALGMSVLSTIRPYGARDGW